MRATLNHLPWQTELLQGSGMPMAVVVSPMALPDPQDDVLQVRGGGGAVAGVKGCTGVPEHYLLQPGLGSRE